MKAFVSEKYKRVVVPWEGVIRQAIAEDKTFEVNGTRLVYMPHTQEAVILLNNLGIEVKPPVLSYYDFNRPPFEAQRDTVRLLTTHDRAFVLNGMGTGKTLSCLWAFDWLKSQGTRQKALVIAPLSTLTMVWQREVFANLPHLSTQLLFHKNRDKRRALLDEEADIYIINHDGLKVMGDLIEKRDDIDTIIVDEIATFREKRTERWKALNRLVKMPHVKSVWGLTGTPTPNAPTDAYAQCLLINPDAVPKYFGEFRAQTMNKLNEFKWLPKADAADTVKAAMVPSVRWKRSDCFDLPETMETTIEVTISKAQEKAYNQMMKEMLLEIEDGTIEAINEGVKVNKLLQIASGFIYNDEKTVALDPGDRLTLIEDMVREAEGKSLVFVPYKRLADMVAQHLLTVGIKAAVITGDVPKPDRDEIFHRFQGGNTLRTIVAHPGTMAHGLTLTEANTVIWALPYPSLEIYEQANARITRPGQKRQTHIIHLEGTPIERRILKRLADKASLQGVLLTLIEERTKGAASLSATG